ncbi:hypothetical protein [Sphingobacterium siyangense]|uniref:Uncharacterized protein n=1 Tax=Sphingobacterium siyangense TaxID=459529 RepID=A0A562MB87_9SPHI|nr:hypothetical protein [Sphingobacterium siyangense]TWI17195.1 hypothetical protein IQ31_03931 [Sphingobacterium siyangense]
MIRSLNQLEDAIHAYGILQDSGSGSTIPSDESIIVACEALIRDSEQLYISHAKSGMARESFRRYYTKFRLLFDKLYKYKSYQPDHTVAKIHEGIWQSIHHFKEHMNPMEELSLYDQQLLKESSLEKLAKLSMDLNAKQLDEEYLLEINYGLHSLFDEHKLPRLLFYHCEWLATFLSALESLAQDQRDKHYAKRFMELLIRYNFNYLGLRNRWHEQLERKLAPLSKSDQISSLLLLEKEITHYRPLPMSNYDVDQPNLKTMMNEYIGAELDYLEKISKLESQERDTRQEISASSSGIHMTLTGEGITCLFHYSSKVGLFKDKHKSDAAVGVAQHIVTKRGNHITANQLTKFNKFEHILSLYLVEDKLKEMLHFIKKDIEDVELRK